MGLNVFAWMGNSALIPLSVRTFLTFSEMRKLEMARGSASSEGSSSSEAPSDGSGAGAISCKDAALFSSEDFLAFFDEGSEDFDFDAFSFFNDDDFFPTNDDGDFIGVSRPEGES